MGRRQHTARTPRPWLLYPAVVAGAVAIAVTWNSRPARTDCPACADPIVVDQEPQICAYGNCITGGQTPEQVTTITICKCDTPTYQNGAAHDTDQDEYCDPVSDTITVTWSGQPQNTCIVTQYPVTWTADDAGNPCNDPAVNRYFSIRVVDWTWSANPAISGGDRQFPATESANFLAGQRAEGSCQFCVNVATDKDTRTCPGHNPVEENDTVYYTWTASFGTFPSGNTGRSVTWVAPVPTSTTTGWVKCTISDAGTGGRDDQDKTVTWNVTVVKPRVYKVDFQTHKMYHDQYYPGHGSPPHSWACNMWDNSGTEPENPEYDETAGRNLPAYFRGGYSDSISISWRADNGQPYTLACPAQVEYCMWWAEPSRRFAKTGTVTTLPMSGMVTLDPNLPLPQTVFEGDNYGFSWAYYTPVGGTKVNLNTTYHDFVARSYTRPYYDLHLSASEISKRRVKETCKEIFNRAADKGNVEQIVTAVVFWLDSDVVDSAGSSPLPVADHPLDLWCHLDSNAPGIDCDDQAYVAEMAAQLVGIKSCVGHAFPSTDCDFNQETQFHFDHLDVLVYYDGNGHMNYFEGYLDVEVGSDVHRYWTVMPPSGPFNKRRDLLANVVAFQYWHTKTGPDTDVPCRPAGGLPGQCLDEEPTSECSESWCHPGP